jgi:LPXTG-site transpeptidase (sortase) family protein
MNIHKKLFIISVILFSSGFSVVAPLGLSWLEHYRALSSVSATSIPLVITTKPNSASKPDYIEGTPRHITVPSLGIDTNIVDGLYDNKTGNWTLTEDSAFFATTSNLVNSDSGNTFIYGHNSQKIFGKLLNINAGAEVIITTDNGYEFTYVFLATEAVRPTDVYTLNYSGKPRLTLQTCSGVWNQTRQMSYYELTKYRKI